MTTRRFRALLSEMDPDRRARIRARTDELLATLPLNDLVGVEGGRGGVEKVRPAV
jgi:hypothetical protein